MNKEVYEIDEDGFIIELYLIGPDDQLPEGNIVPIDLPQPNFYRPKWSGEEWVEGATQEEIDEMTKVEPQPPTETEQRLADLELMMTELMMGGI